MVLKRAQKFDDSYSFGMPVMSIFTKALLLRGTMDTIDARYTTKLHEKSKLERERAEAQKLVESLSARIEACTEQAEALRRKAQEHGGGDLACTATGLEEKFDREMWRQRGTEVIQEAEARALAEEVEKATTENLEAMLHRFTKAADTMKSSNKVQEALDTVRHIAEDGIRLAVAMEHQAEDICRSEAVRGTLTEAGHIVSESVNKAIHIAEDIAEEIHHSEAVQQALVEMEHLAEEGVKKAVDTARHVRESEAVQAAMVDMEHLAEEGVKQAAGCAETLRHSPAVQSAIHEAETIVEDGMMKAAEVAEQIRESETVQRALEEANEIRSSDTVRSAMVQAEHMAEDGLRAAVDIAEETRQSHQNRLTCTDANLAPEQIAPPMLSPTRDASLEAATQEVHDEPFPLQEQVSQGQEESVEGRDQGGAESPTHSAHFAASEQTSETSTAKQASTQASTKAASEQQSNEGSEDAQQATQTVDKPQYAEDAVQHGEDIKPKIVAEGEFRRDTAKGKQTAPVPQVGEHASGKSEHAEQKAAASEESGERTSDDAGDAKKRAEEAR
eukprot:gnl/TRDRNA2_/TRDRNA2_156625_c0_seq1.p1 gnl/TRDRNA2_/TRDRNA2_156625_c0~~gnl/TRDRNA2_/TRDRNA2_156625_c0_seq1.p1  ORF type:complete len:570 (-),score=161.94 gnl/TRDRNA2_/TRDRNA2_156625_c0_seq1:125-1801(-)